MARRILMWAVFAVFVGILVAGALIRTWDRTARAEEARGNGTGCAQNAAQPQGRGRLAEANAEGRATHAGDCDSLGQGLGQGRGQGQGQGLGQGQGQGLGQGQVLGQGQGSGADLARVSEWITVEGVVLSIDEATMTVQTADGETVLVEGRPWQFAVGQGFVAAAGDKLTIRGFHEDGEFKAGRIDDATNGLSVELRDESGRPGWSGQGARQEGAEPGH